MGPNDQYPYYYNNSTGRSNQPQYANYQNRPAQYQHARQSSSSTPAQTYGAGNSYQQTNYSNDQAQSSYNQNYYRDGGQSAAETLSRMGTTTASYPASSSTYNQNTNNYDTSYNQSVPTTTYSTPNNYGTANSQQRPNSVNSVRSNMASARSPVDPVPRTSSNSQYARTQLSTVQQQQRPASPAQIQASHQLQRMADQRNAEQNQAARATQSQQSFVDPSAVYDPWPEYQRKLAAARAAKEVEERAAAERAAGEKWLAEEEAAKQAELKKQKEAEEKAQKKAEAARKKAEKQSDGEPKKKRKSKGAAAESSAAGMNLAQLTALANASSGTDAEAQIRQLMGIVKQMNDKHPDLLAKIWEEERQQHLEGSAAAPPAADSTAEIETPKSSKKKKSPKKRSSTAPESNKASGSKKSTTAAAQPTATPTPTPLPTSVNSSAPKAATPASRLPPPKSNTAKGTIWPTDKKDQIAAAAVRWLSQVPLNHGKMITASQISRMLDKNPTYIELCEMIEKLGLKVDRGAFARQLLSSVPGVNSKSSAASPAVPTPAQAAKSAVSSASTGAIADSTPVRSSLPPIESAPFETPYFDSAGQPLPTTQPNSKSKSKGTKKNTKAEKEAADSDRPSETPGPTTKAEAARKRTFADLVDLTSLSDDDDLPPAKQPFFGPGPVTQPGQAYSSQLDFLPNFDGVVDPYLQNSMSNSRQAWPPNSYNAQPNPQHDKSMARLQSLELAKPIDRKNALRRSRYDIRTLARDVLLATGKHPELLPLNGHLESLRSFASIDLNSDLSTIRWDSIDPGNPIPAALEGLQTDADSVIDEADDESEEEVRNFAVRAPVPQPVARAVAVGTGERSLSMSAGRVDPGTYKQTPTRGRPRGRPSGMSRYSTGAAQTPLGNHTAGQVSTTPASAPPPGSGYSAFAREVRPDGTKRRGRPVGWRKAIHQKGVGNHPGGGPTPTRQPVPQPASEPKFAVFKCGWKDCSAELHNLETLRRHVNKKHGIPDKSGRFTCLWSGCGKNVQSLDAETGQVSQGMQRYNYPDNPTLMSHVEVSHVRPIGWEHGDGPAGGFSGSNATDSEAYLSDAHGRQVTPRISGPPPSASNAGPSGERGRGRPPKKPPEQEAKEQLDDLALKKREIGLGVDRGGATFANEKRRAGFIDDEDEEEVFVDANE